MLAGISYGGSINLLRSTKEERFLIFWVACYHVGSLCTRVSEHKKAVMMFDHNSKLACHVHECHHPMDF